MSLHVGISALWSPFQPPLNLRSISGTSARNRGDAKGLAAIPPRFTGATIRVRSLTGDGRVLGIRYGEHEPVI
jgi:hypothetical protein